MTYARLIVFSLYIFFTWQSITMSLSANKFEKPQIQQALQFDHHQGNIKDIGQYYVSEKLDGMRGFWDGKQLISRQGNLIVTPDWFTKHWPKIPMDGELWLGRSTFQALMSCIKSRPIVQTKRDSCWHHIKFMIFDLPTNTAPFANRVKQMQILTQQSNSIHLAMIKQELLHNEDELNNMLDSVVDNRGEGLMLHLATSYYYKGRSSELLKVKRHQDAEAIVIAHTQGKGKYTGMLGAIEVKTVDGVIFKIGSGFSDTERKKPPPIGSTVTYKFNGFTTAGIPRFARFWRIKLTE